MRLFLEAFRLPGESQQINRIAEIFASIYFRVNPGASSFLHT
jgi:brefeldin A-resistance guanine nucleotide exchange factor 1